MRHVVGVSAVISACLQELGGLGLEIWGMNPALSETIAVFTVGDLEYEIDHLGLTDPADWGRCTVNRVGRPKQLAAFVVTGARPPGRRDPGSMGVTDEQLVELARAALADR